MILQERPFEPALQSHIITMREFGSWLPQIHMQLLERLPEKSL